MTVQSTFLSTANIAILTTGFSMGWTSPMNTILGNVTTSPLEDVVTTDEEAWIGSLLNVGAIFGTFSTPPVFFWLFAFWVLRQFYFSWDILGVIARCVRGSVLLILVYCSYGGGKRHWSHLVRLWWKYRLKSSTTCKKDNLQIRRYANWTF